MIHELDETLRQLLVAELPVKNGEIEISFDQPRHEWSARLNSPAVNLYLYDVRENAALRHQGWESAANGKHSDNLAHLKRSPVRIDCSYVLSTWARDPEDEHSLLTRCLLALFRHPSLPEKHLAGSLKNQPYEIQARVAQPDKLTNPSELWSALDNQLRPSIPYILTLALDPWSEVTGPLVRSLTLRTGQALPRRQGLVDGTQAEWVEIGGIVRERGSPGSPLPGIDVAIKGTGLVARSDAQGRFQLGSIPPGDYILVAWPAEGRPVEQPISLPAAGDQFEIKL